MKKLILIKLLTKNSKKYFLGTLNDFNEYFNLDAKNKESLLVKLNKMNKEKRIDGVYKAVKKPKNILNFYENKLTKINLNRIRNRNEFQKIE